MNEAQDELNIEYAALQLDMKITSDISQPRLEPKMKRFLKIKIKSLAAEAKIIRAEEAKVLGFARWCRETQGLEEHLEGHHECYAKLHRHRTYDVRDESRVSFLAYAFLRGKTRVSAERDMPPGYIVERASKVATRFGGNIPAGVFVDWCKYGIKTYTA